MTVILSFPTARVLLDPELRTLRARLGLIGADEAAGLHALDAGECDDDRLREYLTADIDADTLKAYLRAYARGARIWSGEGL